MEDVVRVIRSLLTSTDGLLIGQIDDEYKEIVGESIPFAKFGFASLLDFLRSADAFSGKRTAAGIQVTAKASADSAHITAMRHNQNFSKGDRKRKRKLTTPVSTRATPAKYNTSSNIKSKSRINQPFASQRQKKTYTSVQNREAKPAKVLKPTVPVSQTMPTNPLKENTMRQVPVKCSTPFSEKGKTLLSARLTPKQIDVPAQMPQKPIQAPRKLMPLAQELPNSIKANDKLPLTRHVDNPGNKPQLYLSRTDTPEDACKPNLNDVASTTRSSVMKRLRQQQTEKEKQQSKLQSRLVTLKPPVGSIEQNHSAMEWAETKPNVQSRMQLQLQLGAADIQEISDQVIACFVAVISCPCIYIRKYPVLAKRNIVDGCGY